MSTRKHPTPRTYVVFHGTREQKAWLNTKLEQAIKGGRAANSGTSFFYPYKLASGLLPAYNQGVFTLPLPEPMHSIKQGDEYRGTTYDLTTDHTVMFTRVKGPNSEWWILCAPTTH